MRGTAFNPGQMAELTSSVSGAVAAALPKVAAKFGDPKAVLKSMKDKSEVLAARLETAIESAIKSMMALTRHPQRSVTISARRNPDEFFQTREGLYVSRDFRSRVVAKATPVDIGASFKINEDELGEPLSDQQIEDGLPGKHLVEESALCAVLSELIESGALDKNCWYLVYTSSCVVDFDWDPDGRGWLVDTWRRGDVRWDAGGRVFSPAI